MGIVTGSYDYNVICKVCDVKLKASESKKRWDGLVPVCPECWESRHPMDFFRTRNDQHKLPFTNKEPSPDNGTILGADFEIPTIVVNTSAANATVGTRFTCLQDVTLEGARLWAFREPGAGDIRTGQIYSWRVGLYRNTGPTLLWSKTISDLKQDQWNGVPITPNVALTAGETYTICYYREQGTPFMQAVGGAPASTTSPLFTFGGAYFILTTGLSFPNSSVPGDLYMIDVQGRPTT